jgi:hypothetical protein
MGYHCYSGIHIDDSIADTGGELMNDLSQLKVGDQVLILCTWNDAAVRAVIVGETKTAWRVSGKLYSKVSGQPKGLVTWDVNYTYIEPYDAEKHQKGLLSSKKRQLVNLFQETRFQDLSLEALQELLTVLQKHRKQGQ